MAKPATEARLAAAANGFTQVLARGNSHIITKNPTTGKCAYDGQVGGGWHYGEGLETDTAWQAGTAPWNWQMVKALYNVYALSIFSSGQIIKWVDPGSGQYVTFQPMALQWTNSLNQIQQISMPQSVAAQASDDVLYWPAAYGSGRNFRYQATPLRLNKQLIIDSPSALPSTSYDTLELNFIIGMSAGVTAYVDIGDGTGLKAWDKKTRKDTAKAIEFRLSGGAVVWSFAIPRAWDSAGNETTGSMRLKKSGSRLYVSVRFPKSWISAVPADAWPIYIDPAVDYQTGAGADDGRWSSGSFKNGLTVGILIGCLSSTDYVKNFVRFTGVTIPAGATVISSYLSFCFNSSSGTMHPSRLSAEDAASPNAVSSESDGNSRVHTTNNISITSPTPSAGDWWDSDDIDPIIQELVDSYSYATGAAMQFFIFGHTEPGTYYGAQRTYEYSGNVSGPKLHIEYTEAAGGNPFYAYAQQ